MSGQRDYAEKVRAWVEAVEVGGPEQLDFEREVYWYVAHDSEDVPPPIAMFRDVDDAYAFSLMKGAEVIGPAVANILIRNHFDHPERFDHPNDPRKLLKKLAAEIKENGLPYAETLEFVTAYLRRNP